MSHPFRWLTGFAFVAPGRTEEHAGVDTDGVGEFDLRGAGDAAALVGLLRELKQRSGLTLRELEERARARGSRRPAARLVTCSGAHVCRPRNPGSVRPGLRCTRNGRRRLAGGQASGRGRGECTVLRAHPRSALRRRCRGAAPDPLMDDGPAARRVATAAPVVGSGRGSHDEPGRRHHMDALGSPRICSPLLTDRPSRHERGGPGLPAGLRGDPPAPPAVSHRGTRPPGRMPERRHGTTPL